MNIIDSIIQRNSGLPSTQREGGKASATIGHSDQHGGLRGHSIDATTYPWRVVGHGDGAWSVHGVAGEHTRIAPDPILLVSSYFACNAAHTLARTLKVLHPSGREA